jgi:hypothetical protein
MRLKRLLASLGLLAMLGVVESANAAQPLVLGVPETVTPGRHGVAAVKFKPNLPALRKGGGDFSLALPGGPQVTLRRVLHQDRGQGDLFWRGEVLHDDGSLVALTVKNGVMAGTIQAQGTTYVIRASSAGQVLEQAVPRTQPRDIDPVIVPMEAASQRDASRLLATGAAVGGATTQIDVMVLYTTAVMNAAGGSAQVEAEIQANVDLANVVFTNSRVKATYRLVYAGPAPVGFQTDPQSYLRLEPFSRDSDVQALRSRHGADLVALYLNSFSESNLCGIAVGNNMASPNGQAAHQIFDRSTCPDLFTYAHENGHLLGMSHNPESAGTPPSNYYPFGFGHYVLGVFGSVMSYNGPTIAYFSNPKIKYQGYATGIPNERDNAQVATLNAPIIAAQSPPGIFDPPPTVAPPAPSGLLAQLTSSPGEIRLVWLDNSAGSAEEDNFEIERSVDGVNFQPWAMTPQNQSTYVDGGLNPGETFFYRVRAVNGLGASGFSNVATQAVGGVPAAPSDVQAIGISSQSIQFSWTDNSNNELAFMFEVFLGGVWEPVDEAVANAESHVHYPTFAGYSLEPQTTYFFRLSAINDFGVSAGVEVAATTLAAPTAAPAAASSLALTPVKAGTGANAVFSGVQMSWLDNSTDEAGFLIERCKVSGTKSQSTCLFEPLRTVAGAVGTDARQFLDSNFDAADYKGTYRYRVTAVNQAGSAAAAAAQLVLK